MKTIDIIGAGTAQEFSSTSHKLHQDALLEVARSIVLGLGVSDDDFTVLFGLEAIAGTPDWEISPGAIYYDGEIYYCDGIEGNDGGDVPVLSITQTAIGNPSKTSTAGLVQTHFERKIVISFAAVDSADVNFADLERLDDKMEELLMIDNRIAEAGVPKADKDQGAWTDIVLAAEYSARNGMTPQYRVDQFGIVHLRGQINIDSDGSFITSVGAVPNCPSGSGGNVTFPVSGLESSASAILNVIVSSSGRLSLPAGYPAAHVGDSFFLNGISYDQEAY